MTFADHPAFDADIDRQIQIRLLSNLQAVIPYQERIAAAWLYLAMIDARAVEGARVALDDMPEATRRDVVSRARRVGP